MPTILNLNGFRFIIWPADHEPAHVHVFRGNGEAKIWLGGKEQKPSLARIDGMTRQEIRKAWEMTAENQVLLLESWERIHG